MKLNIHLNGFAMKKDFLTEKTKCQVLFTHDGSAEKSYICARTIPPAAHFF